MIEHDEQADRLDDEAQRMERESERVAGDVEGARREWDSKKQDQSVPGAQELPSSAKEGAEADEGEDEGAVS